MNPLEGCLYGAAAVVVTLLAGRTGETIAALVRRWRERRARATEKRGLWLL